MIRKILSNRVYTNTIINFTSQMVVSFVALFVTIIISRNDLNLDKWTALQALIQITTIFTLAFNNHISKRTSEISKSSNQESLQYYNFFNKKITEFQKWVLITSILLSFAISFLLKVSYLTSLFTILYLTVDLKMSFRQNYIMGMLEIKKFALNNLIFAFIRLVSTLVMVFLFVNFFQDPVIILPLSLLTSTLVANFWLVRVLKIQHTNIKPIEYCVNLRSELKNAFTILISNLIFSLIIFAQPIVSYRNFSSEDADLFAVIFQIGLILSTISAAMFQLVSVYIARGRNTRFIFYGFIVSLILIISSIGAVTIFSDLLLSIFGKSQYFDRIDVFVLYLIFSGIMSFAQILVRYIIGIGVTKEITPLFVITSISLVVINFVTRIEILIVISMFTTIINSLYLLYLIDKDRKENMLKK